VSLDLALSHGRSRVKIGSTGLMALALALSPTYPLVRLHIGSLALTLLEIVLVLAVLSGLYAFWEELPWRSPYTWPALLLLLAATIDTVFAPDRRAAAGIWKAYFVEPAAAGLVIAAIATQRERARLLLVGLGIAGTVVAGANIAVEGYAVLTTDLSRYVVTPPVVIYETANAVPLYLEPLLAFALAVAFFSDDRRERLIGGSFTLLAALAIFLSFSRAGWATLVAVAAVVAVFSRWRWWMLGGAAAAGAVLFAGSRAVRRRVLVEFDLNSKDNTIGLRMALWKSALNMLRHHPLLGGGLSGFKQSLAPYRDPAYHEDLIYPHNLVLNFWSETGLLGLVAFLWLLLQMVRLAIRGLRLPGRVMGMSPAWSRAMAVGLLGMVGALIVHGLVDVPYFKNDQSLAYWALLGIQLGTIQQPERLSSVDSGTVTV
jgi:O-antigen ligase